MIKENEKQWILLAVLLAAVKLMFSLWSYIQGFGYLLMILENVIFLGIMGVAVLGVRRYRWPYWVYTIALSTAGVAADSMVYRLGSLPYISLRLNHYSGSIIYYPLYEIKNLAGSLIVMAVMSLLLFGRCLKRRKARLRTFGKLKWSVCIIILAALIGISAWANLLLGIHYENRAAQQPEDPLMLLFYFIASADNRVMKWVVHVSFIVRRLVKALYVWIFSCGVIGFPQTGEME